MRFDRMAIGVPVLIGVLGVGTAYGHVIIGGPTVRDTVYPTCAHNGVSFNKQGHANCGLHKGWSKKTGDTPPPTDVPPATPPSGDTGLSSHPAKPVQAHVAKPGHPAKPTHPAKPDKAPRHAGGTSTGHGHAYGHEKQAGHAGKAHGKNK
jgi:hypothetical protein